MSWDNYSFLGAQDHAFNEGDPHQNETLKVTRSVCRDRIEKRVSEKNCI